MKSQFIGEDLQLNTEIKRTINNTEKRYQAYRSTIKLPYRYMQPNPLTGKVVIKR